MERESLLATIKIVRLFFKVGVKRQPGGDRFEERSDGASQMREIPAKKIKAHKSELLLAARRHPHLN